MNETNKQVYTYICLYGCFNIYCYIRATYAVNIYKPYALSYISIYAYLIVFISALDFPKREKEMRCERDEI